MTEMGDGKDEQRAKVSMQIESRCETRNEIKGLSMLMSSFIILISSFTSMVNIIAYVGVSLIYCVHMGC